MPKGVARFITVPTDRGYHYLLLEDIITAFLDRIFPGEPILESAPFRITRNADMSVREDAAGDLLEKMKEVLTERKQSSCVRLEIGKSASDVLRSFLKTSLDAGRSVRLLHPRPARPRRLLPARFHDAASRP